MVFAAGRGTRLRPLTDRLPKALVPILDVPLIDLALARGAGVTWAKRFVNVSHRGDLLREHLEGRADITILDEGDEPLGTSGTLRHLLPELGEIVVTYNCDLVSDLEVAELLSAHESGSRAATLAVSRVDCYADLVHADSGLRLVDRRLEDTAGFMFLGAACFSRSSIENIPGTVPLGLTEGLLRPLVEVGEVALWEHAGYARDTGTHERYLRTSIELLRRPDLVRGPGTLVSSRVALGTDVADPSTVMSSAAYVGPGAVVDHSSVRAGAIVLAGARVGAGTTLSECIVWPGEVIRPGVSLRRGIYYDGAFIQL